MSMAYAGLGEMQTTVKQIKDFTGSFIDRFNRDQTTTLAASLAFYTALSLAPLLILFITFSARISDTVQKNFISQAQALVGMDAAKAIEMIINSAKDRPDLVSTSGIFGILTLLFSASLIFGELRSALNQIFEIKVPPPASESLMNGVWNFLKAKFLHIGYALSFIFIMIVSLIASSVISATFHSEEATIAWVINILVSLISYIGLFTLLFHYLPNAFVPWRRAFQGGMITALLFVVGKELIGIYLGNSAVGSSYGAAGSVIVLLVWVYYSAMITFVGAHVSSLLAYRGPV
jgi:membrane protein